MWKVLGWIFVPYIMLLFNWNKLATAKRYVAIGYIGILFISFMVSGNTKEQYPMASSPPVQQAKTTTETKPVEEPRREAPPLTSATATATAQPANTQVKADTPPQATITEKAPTKETGEGVNPESYDVLIHFPGEKYPETASHILSAIKKGESAVCTIDRKDADQHRAMSLEGIPTKSGYDRDEFPMAMCAEGGAGADIAYVNSSDNRGSGSWVGNHLEGYTDGTRVLFVVDGGKEGPVITATKEPTTTNKETSKADEPAPVPKSNTIVFNNCTEAKKAGYYNIHRGEPGYSLKLDRDNDGVACEK